MRNGAFTTIGPVIGPASGGNWSNGFNTAANQVYAFAGTLVPATAADSVLHAVNTTLAASISSSIYVDGSATTGNTGIAALSTGLELGSNRTGSQFATCTFLEAGVNSNQFSAGGGALQISMNANQHGINGWNF
jgi:hypothetical protein